MHVAGTDCVRAVVYTCCGPYSQRQVNASLLQGTIEGRRDIAGGRLAGDRRAAGNATSGQCFTSLAYSADGSLLLAGAACPSPCMRAA